MEERRFDELTKQLARPVPRRTVLRAVLATALGGMASLASLGRSSAQTSTCGAVGALCSPPSQYGPECCSGYCTAAGTCGCPAGRTYCAPTGGTPGCVPGCTGGQVLVPATCSCECPHGTTLCRGTCTRTCPPGQTFDANCACVCATPACGPGGGTVCCASGAVCCGTGANAICTNVSGDAANCGACGNACPTGQSCCGGACIDTSSNPGYCGGCTPGHACAAGLTCCNGACVNTQTSSSTCGSCSNSCATGTCCSGVCADTTSDSANCGACGTLCPNGQTCQNSSCACPANTFLCGGACVPNGQQTCGSTCCGQCQVCQSGRCSTFITRNGAVLTADCMNGTCANNGVNGQNCSCFDGTQFGFPPGCRVCLNTGGTTCSSQSPFCPVSQVCQLPVGRCEPLGCSSDANCGQGSVCVQGACVTPC